jgi:hypothetical protein
MPAAEMDGRTDLYAMGCVFYEMLTGHTPFHAHNTSGWMKQHLEETPRLPSELRPELANWTGLDGLTMRLLAKNRNDRPHDAEVLSLLDTAQSDTRQLRKETVVVSAREHPQTVIEEGSRGRHEPATTPPQQTVMQAQPVSHAQPVVQLAPQPSMQAQKPPSQKIPVWAWGVLAVVVVMAVAAGFAAIHFLTPKPQTEQSQATATQPAVIPPSQASTYTYTSPNQPTVQQKPSPGSPASGANVKPPGNQPASSQATNPAQVKNTPPIIIQPPSVQIQVTPPAHQPSNTEITQQAIALYNQKNFSAASPLLDKACTGGSGEACRDLGNMYRDGSGVGKDSLHAASLYSKACNASPPLGCVNLGVMYHNGDGVSQDDSKAATLYSQACNAGDAIGCSNLGSSYWYGRGVPQDDSHAAALYSRACDANNGAGCSNMGNCYLSGRGVGGKDPGKARELFKKGCGLGNQPACDQLRLLK